MNSNREEKSAQTEWEEFIKNNIQWWDDLVAINSQSQFYDLPSFIAGASSLKDIELQQLGDIDGKSILHLQCHFGMDTLSLARMGANVTGVDFSPKAIELAIKLSDQLNISANFICSDIYKLPNVLNKKFDMVYTSYGVLTWLCDLNQWANIVSNYLKQNGSFYIVEFHPFTHMFDDEWKQLNKPYFYGKTPIEEIQKGSYADKSAEIIGKSHEWPHTISEVIYALRQADIILDDFHELPFSSHNCFPSLKEKTTNQFVVENHENMPLMYSIKATYMPKFELVYEQNLCLQQEIENLKLQLKKQVHASPYSFSVEMNSKNIIPKSGSVNEVEKEGDAVEYNTRNITRNT